MRCGGRPAFVVAGYARRVRVAIALALVAAGTACPGRVPVDADDGGVSFDGGVADAGASVDGGAVADAGALLDGGRAVDAGALPDAGAVADGGANVDADAGAVLDAGALDDAGARFRRVGAGVRGGADDQWSIAARFVAGRVVVSYTDFLDAAHRGVIDGLDLDGGVAWSISIGPNAEPVVHGLAPIDGVAFAFAGRLTYGDVPFASGASVTPSCAVRAVPATGIFLGVADSTGDVSWVACGDAVTRFSDRLYAVAASSPSAVYAGGAFDGDRLDVAGMDAGVVVTGGGAALLVRATRDTGPVWAHRLGQGTLNVSALVASDDDVVALGTYAGAAAIVDRDGVETALPDERGEVFLARFTSDGVLLDVAFPGPSVRIVDVGALASAGGGRLALTLSAPGSLFGAADGGLVLEDEANDAGWTLPEGAAAVAVYDAELRLLNAAALHGPGPPRVTTAAPLVDGGFVVAALRADDAVYGFDADGVERFTIDAAWSGVFVPAVDVDATGRLLVSLTFAADDGVSIDGTTLATPQAGAGDDVAWCVLEPQ